MKKPFKFISIMLILIALTACSKTDVSTANDVPDQEHNVHNESTHSESTTDAADSNTSITPDIAVDEAKLQELLAQFGQETPAKAVTLSVAITELYDALGLELVGVPTTKSQLPEAYADVQRVGSSHQPDLEQIAKLEPNTVLVPNSIKDSMEKMFQPSGLPVAYLPVDSLDELKLSTAALGRLYGKEEQANQVLTALAEQEAAARQSAEGKAAPKVMLLFGSVESLMLMNENTFAGSLAKNLGAENVLTSVLKQSETYVPLNMESIIEANPDVILLIAHGDPTAVAQQFEADVKKNKAWESLSAFKNNKLITLDYNLYGISSIVKAPDAYKDLAAILYN